MTRVLAWLDAASDRLSPIVVKEVRQIVRGREFTYSFGLTLVTALLVAILGAGDASAGASGVGVFRFLTACLCVLGLFIVPFGAFNALRYERLEQTFDLITLTALSPRRIVAGKLLAQVVKLATLFSLVAPFVATSFLLGGIDFVTILVTLGIVFIWSCWMSGAALFASTLVKFRGMGGLLFFGGLLGLFFFTNIARSVAFGLLFGVPVAGIAPSVWSLIVMTVFWAATLVNLVLLAENRLSLPTENRVTPLRIGFLVQLVLIVLWALRPLVQGSVLPRVRESYIDGLAFFAGVHLAVVAAFVVTEDLAVPRRVLAQMMRLGGWRRLLLAPLFPGAGRGAVYVLAQMTLVVAATAALGATDADMRRIVALCGAICLFTGLPALVCIALAPLRLRSIHARVGVLLAIPIALILPDLLYYVFWQPEAFSLEYSARHLVNPFRTFLNWDRVEANGWLLVPMILGAAGFASYASLIRFGGRATEAQELAALSDALEAPAAPGGAGGVVAAG